MVCAPSRRRYSSQMLAISCHDRHARSVRSPIVRPVSGRSRRNVGALTSPAGGAVGRRTQMVSVFGLIRSAYRYMPPHTILFVVDSVPKTPTESDAPWWMTGVLYQIYPLS